MPFGGGSEWYVYYGAVQFHSFRNPLGGIEWELCDGARFTSKVSDGLKVEIPEMVKTKKEVLDLASKLGFSPYSRSVGAIQVLWASHVVKHACRPATIGD